MLKVITPGLQTTLQGAPRVGWRHTGVPASGPAGRMGKPEDIANLALWLASDDAAFATGQCYVLDGGMTAASPLNPGLF